PRMAPQASPLADVLLHFTARVVPNAADGTEIANQAVIIAANTTATTVTNRVVVRVSAVPRLEFTKTVVDGRGLPPAPGDPLTYTLTIRNAGLAFALMWWSQMWSTPRTWMVSRRSMAVC